MRAPLPRRGREMPAREKRQRTNAALLPLRGRTQAASSKKIQKCTQRPPKSPRRSLPFCPNGGQTKGRFMKIPSLLPFRNNRQLLSLFPNPNRMWQITEHNENGTAEPQERRRKFYGWGFYEVTRVSPQRSPRILRRPGTRLLGRVS